MGTVSASFKNASGENEYDVPHSSLLIPLDSTSENLSDLINHLLDAEETIKFRFFIQETLLASPLGSLLEQLGHSLEATVTIEYSPENKLPEQETEQSCPDWIRSISSSTLNGKILTGSFDNVVRIHSRKVVEKEYIGHRGAVTGVKWIDEDRFVSCSSDWTLRLWNKNKDGSLAVLKGHEAAVQTLDHNSNRDLIVSGDVEGRIALWSTDISLSSPEELQVKKQKKKRVKVFETIENAMKAIKVFSAHTDGQVSAVKLYEDKLISSGFDRKLIQWDIEKIQKQNVLSLTTQVSCMDEKNGIFVTGSPDGSVRFVDLRTMSSAVKSAKVHDGWINSIVWSPFDENVFCSASADLKTCIWDRRGLKSGPVKVLASDTGKKVLSVEWTDSGLFFGGEDCILHSFI